jgi:predicted thioesterase
MKELVPGLTAEESIRVDESNVAATFGSGRVPVFSTPYLVALIEGAAMAAVDEAMLPGQDTVGTDIQISHKAATPIGMTVTARARLEKVEGRRLLYTVEAWDDKETISEGSHERFIINREKFLAKVEAKKQAK